MSIDKEKIKKALDDFENDEYVSSKETLKDEIRKAKNDFIKDKLGLKNDIEPEEEELEDYPDDPDDDDQKDSND